MRNRYRADDFQHHIPGGEGEPRSHTIALGSLDKNHVAFEVRCREPLEVNLIDGDGQTVHLAVERCYRFEGTLEGFVAVEVVASAAWCYWFRGRARFLEVPDPTPVAITSEDSVKKPIADLIQQEVEKYLHRKQLDETFASDVSVEELVDDLLNGDHEFENEPDEFGLGYAERLEEWERAQKEAARAREEQAAQPVAETATAPAGPANAPGSDGPPSAEKPGVSSSPGSPLT